MSEHPSLKVERKPEQSINEVKSQIQKLSETLQKLQVDSTRLAEDFQTLDAVELLSQLQASLTTFMERYGGKIDLLAEVAEEERLLIQKLNGAVDKLV